MWSKINSLYFLKKLDEKFLKFIFKKNIHLYNVLQEKRRLMQNLSPQELIEISFILEEFIIFYFQINIKSNIDINKKWEVKREFIQRKVFTLHKTFEGEKPDFISEEEFIKLYFEGKENHEKLTSYARFALFTQEGRELHKKDIIFNLPTKLQPSFASIENEIFYTKTPADYFKKTQEQSLAETKYCIYCHNQKKDYCRTFNPTNQQAGCPLDQPISEMNYAKAHNGIISPLSILMVENPLCILTGDRICNDCKKACIFTKQTPVDVPSIESAILFDVLKIDYGFEIYFLLTKWNPLKTINFLPLPFNKKKVLVVGAGPSGIASSYYMLQAGFEVHLIDGLKLVSSTTEIIKDVSKILENKNRIQTGFGGVMEYGITERFNKNFLYLAQILLERNAKFALQGLKKFGQDITLKSAKEMGFCHIMFCTGAGKPLMALPKFSLKKGIITASNLLMSCNLQNDWGVKNLKFPVIVIGSGLTAIDAATTAKKYGNEVSIFMRNSVANSKSYTLNDLEVDEALYKGVRIFENKSLLNLTYENERVSGAIFLNKVTNTQEFIKAGTVIFAVGTDHKYIKESKFCSIYGDLNEKFEGSVVKAIASVKYKKHEIISKLSKTKVNSKKIKLKDVVVEAKMQDNLFCIKIKRGIKTSSLPFSTFKLQTLHEAGHSIPLTLFENKKNILTFYIKPEGTSTKELLKIKKGDEILLMKSFENKINFQSIVCDDDDFKKIIKPNNKNGKGTLLYVKNKSALQQVQNKKDAYVFLFNEMGCMLSGVCSRCLTQKKDGSLFFACKKNIIKLKDIDI